MEFCMLLAGLVLYAGYGIGGLVYLAACVLLSYCLGLLTPKWKMAAWLGIGLQALILVAVKLKPVTGMEFAAPLGISYFTLRVISYHADLLRGKYKPVKNLLGYSLYVTFFPAMFLGPIESYDRFRSSLNRRSPSWDLFSRGLIRVLWGGMKKLVIAARAGVLIGTISAAPDKYRGAYALFAMVLYSLQLYSDFSGGIDMVLGVCNMLGLRFSENFNLPFLSETVSEFWRRWHMTLGSWLREYVYIPLGGNRKGKLRKYINLIITFFISGLWHGVHYLLWGIFNGIFVAMGDLCKTRVRMLNRLGTGLVISLLWAFFVWPETLTAMKMLLSVVTVFNWGDLWQNILQLGLNGGEWIVLLAGTALMIRQEGKHRYAGRFSQPAPVLRTVIICSLALGILIFGMYGIGFDAQAFIYSKF